MTKLYVSTYLGNRFYPLEPRIDDVAVEDIAHGLAYQCRFNGQTNAFYSVAQHSLIVASLVPEELRFAALLHDAAEAYLGDMVKPLKVLLPSFSEIEDNVSRIIGERFGVDLSHNAIVKQADLIALATEKRDLMPYSVEEWTSLIGVEPMRAVILTMPPDVAKREFMREFERMRNYN
jgi:5'-deoxynucleotidase YfbR-like HD superfamily hydrolase